MDEAAVGRNQPCPCGSGKRYKECHGLVRREDGAPAPDAVALLLQGHREYTRGRREEAVQLFLAAARRIETGTASAADQYEIWTELNFALRQALYGIDGALTA